MVPSNGHCQRLSAVKPSIPHGPCKEMKHVNDPGSFTFRPLNLVIRKQTTQLRPISSMTWHQVDPGHPGSGGMVRQISRGLASETSTLQTGPVDGRRRPPHWWSHSRSRRARARPRERSSSLHLFAAAPAKSTGSWRLFVFEFHRVNVFRPRWIRARKKRDHTVARWLDESENMEHEPIMLKHV